MASEPSIYTLNSGDASAERERLDLQHGLFHNVMENQLLPPNVVADLAAIPASSLGRPPRVCELATGSAVWLRELARTLPADAELVGLDSDTSKFPGKDEVGVLPPNVRLLQGNMFGPFPEDLLGRFDVVHMRLVVMAVRKGMGPVLAKAALSLLRPGGWLVWADVADMLGGAQPPSQALFRFNTISYDFAVSAGREQGIPLGIPSYLRSTGFEEVQARAYPSGARMYDGIEDAGWSEEEKEQRRRRIRSLSQRMLLRFVAQGLTGMVALGGTEGLRTAEDAAALTRDAEAEIIGRDAVVNVIFYRAWGRKPATTARI